MRIAYVAKHGCGGNDDEGALVHALRGLGQDVEVIHEKQTVAALAAQADFMLFHHWDDLDTIAQVKIPKVFWYFDLVTFPDPTLTQRNNRRADRMRKVTEMVDIGFCTDGDWVNADKTGKLVRLMQGADERVMGFGTPIEAGYPPIIFVGCKRGGLGRESCINTLATRYRKRFREVSGKYRRDLADIIASTKIVIAPDAPVTDHYFSNRVFLSLGYGAFLLHPYAATLADCYVDGEEIVFYRSRDELLAKIDFYRTRDELRAKIQRAGYERTVKQHTYRHRCRFLLQTVMERLGL